MEWSIQEIARAAGTTSRTLRHYGDVGILLPVRTGSGGIRYYDADALVRLQRILLLRALGLGIPAIRDVLDGERDDVAALGTHLEWLRREREDLGRRIAAVERTLRARERGEEPMAEQMFDGFDHTAYREEVVKRWGGPAYAGSDRWWRGLSGKERAEFQESERRLAADWADAAARGIDPAGDEAQALAARHAEWLADVPGTPGHPDGPAPEYLRGLGDMYVADPRFGARYGRPGFVRDALAAYAQRI